MSKAPPLPRVKPINDPKGEFYIDREYCDVDIYEDGLSNDNWNPTQVLYEISNICLWARPSYKVRDIKRGIFPSFICEVTIKSQKGVARKSFMTERGVAKKKTAQHMASVMALRYLGFDFDYENKDASKSPIPAKNLMKTRALTYSERPKFDRYRSQEEREKTYRSKWNRGDSRERPCSKGSQYDKVSIQEVENDAVVSEPSPRLETNNEVTANQAETRSASFPGSSNVQNTFPGPSKRTNLHRIPLHGYIMSSSPPEKQIINDYLRLEVPRKPMDEPEGLFFINKKLVDVRKHEEGLRNGTFNPTQSLRDISHKSGWGEPSFKYKRVERPKNILPCYECEVCILGKSFYTDKDVAQKKIAQHSASAKALRYLGLEFEYVNKETFRIPLMNELLMPDHPSSITSLRCHEEGDRQSSSLKVSEKPSCKNIQDVTKIREATMGIGSQPKEMLVLEEKETCNKETFRIPLMNELLMPDRLRSIKNLRSHDEGDRQFSSLKDSEKPRCKNIQNVNNARESTTMIVANQPKPMRFSEKTETFGSKHTIHGDTRGKRSCESEIHNNDKQHVKTKILTCKHQTPSYDNLATNIYPLNIKPMNDPDGLFYIDRGLINVEMYEKYLRTGKLNPTQALLEISNECDWERPSFMTAKLENTDSQPVFLCKVVINGKYLIPKTLVQQKTMAKHLASAKFLKHIGFEFKYCNIVGFTSSIESEPTKTITYDSECPRSDTISTSRDQLGRPFQTADCADNPVDDTPNSSNHQRHSSTEASQKDKCTFQNGNP